MKEFVKKLTNRREFKIVAAVFTIVLTGFDMGSDLLLAVNYASTGKDDWWFGLTLTFFIVPILLLLLIILMTGDNMKNFKELFPYWKQFECTVESGPQLILQLYIMCLPNIETTGNQNAESNTTMNINVTLSNLHSSKILTIQQGITRGVSSIGKPCRPEQGFPR